MKILLLIIPVSAACAVLFILGIMLYAMLLLIKRPMLRFYRQRSSEADFCPYDQIPQRLIDFILQTEDDLFFSHPGFQIEAIRDAINLNSHAHRIITGGSTITQQLVKNLYFRFEQSYLRKITEFLLTLHAERVLGKQKILELYLNVIYFGNGKYGISDAARFYFDKSPNELSLNQMFMIASMPHAPTAANPLKHPDVFLRVRDKKLALLVRRKTISESDAQLIRSHDAMCLDPQLRACGSMERSFPDTIVMVNERFGLPNL